MDSSGGRSPDAAADVSRRDSRSSPSPGAIAWFGAPAVVQRSGDPVECHVVSQDSAVYRRALTTIERPPWVALEADAGPHRGPPHLRGLDPAAVEVAFQGHAAVLDGPRDGLTLESA